MTGRAIAVETHLSPTGVGLRGRLLVGLTAALAGLFAAVILSTSASMSGAGAAGAVPAPEGLAALLRLPAAAQAPISAALGRDLTGYSITGLVVANPAQRLSARFGRDGATIASGRGRFEIGLRAVGRGARLRAAVAVSPVVRSGTVVYTRTGVAEVWRNGPLGLEQTFVVARRPAGVGALAFAVAVPAGSRIDGGAILLPGGLRYAGLRAVDARGRVLPASMTLRGGRVMLSVDDRGAVYPVRVDPFVQQAQLSEAGGGVGGDEVGYSVAISGATIVVGSPQYEDGDSTIGKAYVFQEGAGGWSTMTQTATLTASDGVFDAVFGYSVAIDGSTIVVGAPSIFYQGDGGSALGNTCPTNPVVNPGAVYVFQEPGTGWATATQTSEIDPPDPVNCGAAFGASVALDANTLVIGAPGADVAVSTLDAPTEAQGAAYVYTLSATSPPARDAILTDGNGDQDDAAEFGHSVAIAGSPAASTIVVGAPTQYHSSYRGAGRAYLYQEPAGGWSDSNLASTELASSDDASADDFGYSVAADGTNVVVGAPYHTGASAVADQEGALYLFEEPSSGWPDLVTIPPGTATDLTQNAELTPSDPDANSPSLGIGGVAISGSTIIGGAANAGSSLYGAAFEFTEPAGGWPATMNETQILQSTNPEASFGTAVAMTGTTALIGADNATPAGPDTGPSSGAAYVFEPGSATTTTSTTTTTTTTTATPTTTTTTTTVGAGDGGHATVAGESVSAKATCTGPATTSCALSYSLTSVETTEKGKPVAIAASKKVKRTKKTVTIGSARAVVTGGGTETVKLTLNGTGRALLAKFRTLPADLTVTQAQAVGAARVLSVQKVTFHAPKAKKKKK